MFELGELFVALLLDAGNSLFQRRQIAGVLNIDGRHRGGKDGGTAGRRGPAALALAWILGVRLETERRRRPWNLPPKPLNVDDIVLLHRGLQRDTPYLGCLQFQV